MSAVETVDVVPEAAESDLWHAACCETSVIFCGAPDNGEDPILVDEPPEPLCVVCSDLLDGRYCPTFGICRALADHDEGGAL